ncbi:MAG: hypothetical protein ACK5DJ_07080, partial [Bacteroidota bacterium]
MKYAFSLVMVIVLAAVIAHADFTTVPPQDNPNGSSELSKLMREMQDYTNRAKAGLKTNAKPEPYPVAFNKIHTAKITDGMSKSDYYGSFSDLYVMSVKNYAKSGKSNRVETYNNMVSACLA